MRPPVTKLRDKLSERLAYRSRRWLARVGLIPTGEESNSEASAEAPDPLTDAETRWLWSSGRLPTWRFAAYYWFAVWLLLLSTLTATFGHRWDDPLHGTLYSILALASGLSLAVSLIASDRCIRLVIWTGQRLGDPLDQVVYALKNIGSTGMDHSLVGLDRRRQYIRNLRHLDHAAERARLDPHGTGPMWSALNDGDNLLPEARAYARDLVRGDLVRIERSPMRRPWPRWLLNIGTVALGAAGTAVTLNVQGWISKLLPGG